jgi:hypothetical protein
VPHYHHFQYKALSFSGTVNWTKWDGIGCIRYLLLQSSSQNWNE